jgi:signal transduction histidine kinase
MSSPSSNGSSELRRVVHGGTEHTVQFYESDTFLEDTVSAYLSYGLRQRDAVLVVAREARWNAVKGQLEAAGHDLATARRSGQLVFLSARETLQGLLRGDAPDPNVFQDVVEPLIERMERSTPGRLRVYGEMVDLLWAEGKWPCAAELERLWNDLLARHPASVLCAYRMGCSQQPGYASEIERVCASHTRVVPAESYARLDDELSRARVVAVLQQRAHDLLGEVERRQAVEDALRQQERELAEEVRRKDEFLAILGHELRNPLSAIVTALHVMRSDREGAMERARAVIERQATTMARLIDDLLAFTRIQHGKIELRREVVNLSAAVDRVVETNRPIFEARRQALSVRLPAAPLHVNGDPVRIEQILTNLLHNASKYTAPDGRIWLEATQEDHEIVLAIRDNGKGMSRELLHHLFEPFVQGEPSSSSGEGGLGLGLALVRGLVALHGGGVRAHSDGPGLGSTFVVQLPAAAPLTAETALGLALPVNE